MNYVRRFIGALALATTLAGCATSNNPQDPFEGFNRTMFGFNDAIDQAALKPAATAYRSILPTFVQIAIGNFFGNIGDVWTAVNNVLQGKLADGFTDVMRVAVNSTLGLGGLIDIGSDAGMAKHKEDFGQTLGVWGVASGPYVVLPFLGSSTVRDSVALPVDIQGDPWGYTTPVRVRNVGSVVRVVDQRAAVLDASNLIEDAALDRYEFVRDAFLQRRANKIDGDASNLKSGDKSSSSQAPLLEMEGGRSAAVMEKAAEPEVKSAIQTTNNLNEDTNTGDAVPVTQLPNMQEQSIDKTLPSAMPVSSNLIAKQLIVSTE